MLRQLWLYLQVLAWFYMVYISFIDILHCYFSLNVQILMQGDINVAITWSFRWNRASHYWALDDHAWGSCHIWRHHTTFLTGLAAVFAIYYMLNLQYQEEAACTLEFIQRWDNLNFLFRIVAFLVALYLQYVYFPGTWVNILYLQANEW